MAGVSAFGFSGTNAHVIVEEAPSREHAVRRLERPLHMLALSARSETALAGIWASGMPRLWQAHAEPAGRYLLHGQRGRVALRAPAGRGRRYRRRNCATALAAAPAGTRVSEREASAPSFCFRVKERNMRGWASELYGTQPVFRAAMDECASILEGELERRCSKCCGEKRRTPGADGVHAARAVCNGIRAGGAVAELGHRAGGGAGAQRRRICGGLRCRRVQPGGRTETDRGAGAADAGVWRAGAHGGGARPAKQQVREALPGLERECRIAAMNGAGRAW